MINNELLLQFCSWFMLLTITAMCLYFIKCEHEAMKEDYQD